MEDTYIYEGTVIIGQNTGKVYLVGPNDVVLDLNDALIKLRGKKVRITIAPAK